MWVGGRGGYSRTASRLEVDTVLSLTSFLLPRLQSLAVRCSVASLVIFYSCFHGYFFPRFANSLSLSSPPISNVLTLWNFTLVPVLCTVLMQQLSIFFTPSFSQGNSETESLVVVLRSSATWTPSGNQLDKPSLQASHCRPSDTKRLICTLATIISPNTWLSCYVPTCCLLIDRAVRW